MLNLYSQLLQAPSSIKGLFILSSLMLKEGLGCKEGIDCFQFNPINFKKKQSEVTKEIPKGMLKMP